MTKPLMICVGKAGQDVFLQSAAFKPKRENGIYYEHMVLGNKYYVEDVVTATGNNAVNAAVTFARQNLPVKIISTVGDDTAGNNIIHTLDHEHIDTSDLLVDEKAKTSFSTILLAPNGERTILDFPGTVKISERQIEEISQEEGWLYVSSLGSMPHLKKLMKLAQKAGIKIAFNPATFELKNLQETADLLEYVDVFAVNKEEAKLFVDGKTIEELAVALSKTVEHVLISDGPRGAAATDGNKIVRAGMYEDVPVIDRTGAGDAFTSGFVSQIAQGKTLEEAVTFASANSTSVVGKIGANTGALHAHTKLHEMALKVADVK
jgi:sugar/nucleoside kinase (ribokinase family)